ncbi:MAG: nuclear transport factor 2 family protein [Bryobacteraceae bacterium]|jgi:ketosteroid isomerase-like protein
MSVEDNVRLIQKAYADYSRGDMAALFDAFADDILWITPGNTELAGERQGKEEVAGFFRTLGEQWDFLAFEPREYIASGDRLVVLGRYDVRSRQTGRTAASHWAMVWTIQNGKATRFQEYTDTSTLEASAGTAAAAAAAQ